MIDIVLIMSYNINSNIFLSRAIAPQVEQKPTHSTRFASST